MIMEIRQKDKPTLPLFCSVDQLRSNRTTLVFTCTPVVEPEARNIVSSLAAFLKHRYGDEVIEFFTKDAQVRARQAFWDEEHQCVRNADDAYLDSLLDDTDADYILPTLSKKKRSTTIPARPVPPSLQRNTFGEEDNDSIGTFREEQRYAHASATVTSDASNSTLATLTSRLSILETLLKTNNIAIPTDSPPSPHSQAEGSVSTGGSPGDRAPGGDV
jgi:hypothetical protein